MKNIARTLAVISFLLLTIWACDKEVGVISSFDFALEESHEEIATINLPQKTTLTIKPEKVVTTNTYRMKYEVLSGDGNYIGTDGSVIPQNEFIPLNALSSDLNYKGTSINVDKVKVTVADSEGNEKTIDINYDVRHNSYTFEASTPVKEVNVNASRAFSTSLFNTGNDKTVHYERAFFIIQGTAKVFNADESEEVEIEKFEPIFEGTVSNIIKFSEAGESKLVVSTKDSNGQVKNDTINFNVNVVDFSFTAASEKNTVFVGEDVNVNFNLSENQGSGGQYQMRFEIKEGNVTIKSGGSPIPAGTLTNVSLGNFSWIVTPIDNNPIELNFYVRNESGAEIQKEVSIGITASTFEFNPVLTSNEANINETIFINSSVTEFGNGQEPYSLIFSSTGTGEVEYNGAVYTAGQKIEGITIPNFTIKYTGSSEGLHQITLALANNSNLERTKSVSIRYNRTTFDFTVASVQNDVQTGTPVGQNFNIIQDGAEALTYSLTFTSTGTGRLIHNGVTYNQGQVIGGISKGSFSANYIGDSVGEHRITFNIRASNNDAVDKGTTINFLVNPYLTIKSWGVPENYEYSNRSLRDQDVAFSGNIIETNSELSGNLKIKYKITNQTGSGSQFILNYVVLNAIGSVDGSDATTEDSYVSIPNNADFTILTNFARLSQTHVGGSTITILFTITNDIQTEVREIRFRTTAP